MRDLGKSQFILGAGKIHLLAMVVLKSYFLACYQPKPLLAPRGCPHSLPCSLLHLQFSHFTSKNKAQFFLPFYITMINHSLLLLNVRRILKHMLKHLLQAVESALLKPWFTPFWYVLTFCLYTLPHAPCTLGERKGDATDDVFLLKHPSESASVRQGCVSAGLILSCMWCWRHSIFSIWMIL